MPTKLGIDARLYRNTGTYAAPTWVAINRIKDNTLTLEKGDWDASTRASGGWRETIGTLKDASIEFLMLQAPSGTDLDFAAIRDAFLNNTSIEFLVLDGVVNVAGVQGLRATMQVMNFSRNENLEEGIAYDVSIKPTPADNAPAWVAY